MSTTCTATAGSASIASTAARAARNAATGSSTTDGTGEGPADRPEHGLVHADDVPDDVARGPLRARRRVVPAVRRHAGDGGAERVGTTPEAVRDVVGLAHVAPGSGQIEAHRVTGELRGGTVGPSSMDRAQPRPGGSGNRCGEGARDTPVGGRRPAAGLGHH
ncbi:MAG: hypothetical protein ABS81_23130 [Pseudonocardia sp. SCN 72-86]|nr:MAG: hypothetical protein ABS81_23130 [Pseudonocardia sp. SCN 72-86]